MNIDDQINQKKKEIESLEKIKTLDKDTLQRKIYDIVLESVEEPWRFFVVENKTYWGEGVKIYFSVPTATWHLAENIIKAGYHIPQITNDNQGTMFWIVTIEPEPEK